MNEALAEARLALERNEVPVGCVFVDRQTSEIVCRSGNRVNESKNATRHAEMVAIDEILRTKIASSSSSASIKEYFKALICYVTVEPCIMCLAALRELGLTESIYGCRNDRFGGTTLLWAREFQKSDTDNSQLLSVTQSSDPKDEETAMYLLKRFYAGQNPSAPVPNKPKIKVESS